MKLFLSTMLLASVGQAQNEIVKLEIREPTTMCSRIACIKLAPGEAGVFNNNFIDGQKLAYGTLHDTDAIGGVLIPAGTLVKFQTPAQEDYDGMDFSATFKEKQVFSGVSFSPGVEVSFDRFKQVYVPAERKHVHVEHDYGFVRIKGKVAEALTIENVTVTDPIFETNAYRLLEEKISDLVLHAGLVAKDSIYSADTPIHLEKGSFVRIHHGKTASLNVWRFGSGFSLLPFGYKASEANFHLPSGRLTNARLSEVTRIQSFSLLGSTSFHSNGNLARFEPAPNFFQTVEGVTINGASNYYFEVQLYPNGRPLVVPTTRVIENTELLPEDVLRGLPDDLNNDTGRITFLFNPKGNIRAVNLEPGRPSGRAPEMYLVRGQHGNYSYEQLSQSHSMYKLVQKANRGYVPPELVEYLEKH